MIALLYGIAGSKLLFVLENISEFVRLPFDTMFSPGGLTFFGGFLAATASIYLTARKAGVSFLLITDATSPGLMLDTVLHASDVISP